MSTSQLRLFYGELNVSHIQEPNFQLLVTKRDNLLKVKLVLYL
jgi:hypothetical protein